MRSRRACRRSASRSRASTIRPTSSARSASRASSRPSKHPNADKLQVIQVEVEKGAPLLEVVCGAPNARAGLVGVFAPLGTYIPGSKITLEKKPVRGVVSNGMMCSAAELELSAEAAGIIELPADMAEPRRRALRRRDGPRRSGVRGEADAEPAGLHRRARHRARSRRGRPRHAEAGEGHIGRRRRRSVSRRGQARVLQGDEQTPVRCSRRAASRA